METLEFAGEGAGQPAISRNNRLAYGVITLDVDIWRIDLNGSRPASKPPTRLISSTRVEHDARYSPDGMHIAFGSNRSGDMELWLCNADGSGTVQLTSFGGSSYTGSPRWSADSRWIAFESSFSGKPGSYVVSVEGGKPKRLPLDDFEDWSRDGKWLYFGSQRDGNRQLWKMPWSSNLQEEKAIQITKKGFAREAIESPDGKFVYYLKNPTGESYALWRVPVNGGEETQVLKSILNNNFTVANGGIYFVPNCRAASLRFSRFGVEPK
jgi:Tol biopolymer transport system component